MRRETGWAGGDARERPVFPARSAGLPWAVLGTGGGAVQPRPGSVPVVLPGRRQVRAAHGPARGVAPCPVARGASRWLVPGGRRGLSAAAAARARGGRIEVIVAWRRARRLGRLCRRDQPPPGTRARCLAAGAWRRPASAAGARTVSRLMPATGSGGMRYLARHLMIARFPPPGSPGRGHDTGAAVTCAFTANGQDLAGLPRASPELSAWRSGTGLAGCQCLLRAAVSPHRPSGPCPDFSNHTVLAGEVFTFGAELGRRGLGGVLPTG